MSTFDKRRLLVIVAVVAIFLAPLILYGRSDNQPAVPLGLDLSGGVDVQIEVDLDYTARQLLNELKFGINAALRSTVTPARLDLTPQDEEPGLRLTLRNPEAHATSTGEQLAAYVQDGVFLPVDPVALASERGVTLRLDPEFLARRADEAIVNALKIIKERVDAVGVAQSDVRIEGGNRIRVQLPGQENPERVINNLVRPATLEFRLAHPEMDNLLPLLITQAGELRPAAQIEEGYEILSGTPDEDDAVKQGQYVGFSEELGEEVAWYLVRRDPEIWGEHLRTVRAQAGGQFGNELVISFELNGDGTRRFRETTEANVDRRLAIILEGRVRSAPVIREAIPYGRGQISGDFTVEEARDLEGVLRTGALPARLIPGEVSIVGASLGEDSIRAGLRASLIGAVSVLVFMLLYYSAAGGIAIIALLINVLIVLGMLSMIRATLTLPGIAGIILTIGMAVDANVLIFERVREELRGGKSLRNAITTGFSRAFVAIFDANVTTLITALVLLQFGFGPVRGFALTMTFGIFATLFTGLFVTQVLMSIYFSLRERLPLGPIAFLEKPKINFMGLRRISYVLSTLMVLAALGDLVVNRGPNLGVDFTGGVQTELAADAVLERGEIESALVAGGFIGPRVQTISRPELAGEAVSAEAAAVASASNFLIRIPQSEVGEDEGDTPAHIATQHAVVGAVQSSFPGASIWAVQSRLVSAEAGARLRLTAIGIAVVAALGIFLYVAIRFDRIYGLASLVALFHDVFITLGLVTLMGIDLNLEVVAALMTIMGYSLNDTIVVFDRMRENREVMEGRDFGDIVNTSINQVLSRTLITSGTTILVIAAMLLLGGPGVHDFAATLLIGFIIGTYSSDFIAAPVVYGRVRRHQLAAAKT